MTKARLIKRIEEAGQYVKVRISADGDVTGMLAEENYRYHKASNTGGRRYIGKYNDSALMTQYSDPMDQ